MRLVIADDSLLIGKDSNAYLSGLALRSSAAQLTRPERFEKSCSAARRRYRRHENAIGLHRRRHPRRPSDR